VYRDYNGAEYIVDLHIVFSVYDWVSFCSLLCLNGTLDPAKVVGKIVACLRGISARLEKGLVVKDAGGIGMILGNAPEDGDDLVADPHFLPATMVNANDAAAIFSYIGTAM